ncbi:MAG: pyridoxal-phosphate dependent enzyme [Saprospiraceae bacterium]|nr:pyridoxal-phosphate dependent enzyme [Saprospiraceae bacterium]
MNTLNLLDGVQGNTISHTREVKHLSTTVQDTSLSLLERIESLEDIISLEVGDSDLSRARNLERKYDIRQLYIKYEGDNPTGTQKDRIAFAQVLDCVRRKFRIISLATCGNYGVACAHAAFLAGIECKIFIPVSYHSKRIGEMEAFGAQVIRLEGTYEDVVTQSTQLAKENKWYDANPGGNNTPIQINAYAEIALEIYDQLRDAPKYLAVPVSNGTLLAGIHRGFVTLHKRGKTSRIPIFVAGSTAHMNPIISSFQKGLDYCEDIPPGNIHETEVNEALINWHSFDGNEALNALQSTNGFAANISDRQLKQMSTLLHKHEGMRILPASSAGLIALLELHKTKPLINDRFVAVLTAKY